MKRLISLFYILCYLFPFTLHAEDVVLQTPYDKEIVLPVPDSYEELKSLTIQIAELYWGERHDLELALDNQDKLIRDAVEPLQETIDELQAHNNSLLEQAKAYNKELQKWLNYDKKRTNVLIGTGFDIQDNLYYEIGIGYKMFKVFTINVIARYPFAIGIQGNYLF